MSCGGRGKMEIKPADRNNSSAPIPERAEAEPCDLQMECRID